MRVFRLGTALSLPDPPALAASSMAVGSTVSVTSSTSHTSSAPSLHYQQPASSFTDPISSDVPPLPAWRRTRAGEHYDLVFKFGWGTSYGPVLETCELFALGANIQVNPLLAPVADEDAPGRNYIMWNMCFPSLDARLSSETDIMWSLGRAEPATFPRVTLLRLISRTFPWTLDVRATSPDWGVTCGDVIETLGTFMQQFVPRSDYEVTAGGNRLALDDAYRYNRSEALDVPGPQLGEGIRIFDFLKSNVMFGGIRVNGTMAFERYDGATNLNVVEVICNEVARDVSRNEVARDVSLDRDGWSMGPFSWSVSAGF